MGASLDPSVAAVRNASPRHHIIGLKNQRVLSTLHFRMCFHRIDRLTEISSSASQSDGWLLVSNNFDNSLELTGIVHHIDGCGMNNGRNQLVPVSADQSAEMKHCMRCEAVLGIRESVSRPAEGTKVEVRLPPAVLTVVDSSARASGASRAATLRSLIEAGLAAQS